ncbi:MAG: CBS domain-containing protein [Anaerolineales bacterium]|nr:CBS domain-containing protein [Anaerolineales bacterium]
MHTLLIVILHDVDRLPELLKVWRDAGVPGVTMLPSFGGFQAQALVKRSGLSSVLGIFDQNKSGQRVLMSLIDDSEVLEVAISEADRVIKGFDRPNSGILFVVPVDKALGLKKWGRPEGEVPKEEEEKESNLMKWFRQDIKDTYGKAMIDNWQAQRELKVENIFINKGKQPVVVSVDTSLQDVMKALLSAPDAPMACVVNNEGRLMGVISPSDLTDVMMIPVVPEAFINDPSGYEKALKYVDPKNVPLAADVMNEPIFVQLGDTLQDAFEKMHLHGFSGLPVVDKHYRVQGYLSLLQIVDACFGDYDKKRESQNP